MQMILSIALGGALGAVARHFVAARVMGILGLGFPFGILVVNVLGSFLMGVLVTLFAEKYALSQEVRAFLTVGLLGGFTTFSAFSMETVLLIERGQTFHSMLYVGASIVLAVAGLFAGMWLTRAVI